MSAENREDCDKTKRVRLRPHTRWTNKFGALYQSQLSDAEREQVEAHFRECEACCKAYLVYQQVAGIMHDPPLLEAPTELPPALQAIKEQQLALAAQASQKHEAADRPKETLRGVVGGRHRKK